MTDLPDGKLDVVGVPSEQFIYEFAEANPNVTQIAVAFDIAPSTFDAQYTNFRYQIWFNMTESAKRYRVPNAPPYVLSSVEPLDLPLASMMRAIDEAICLSLLFNIDCSRGGNRH